MHFWLAKCDANPDKLFPDIYIYIYIYEPKFCGKIFFFVIFVVFCDIHVFKALKISVFCLFSLDCALVPTKCSEIISAYNDLNSHGTNL